MPTQPKPYRDIDDLLAATDLPEEEALVEIRYIAAKAGKPLFTGYDRRKPRSSRAREPVGPDEFIDPRIGRNGPRGKHCLFLGTTLFPDILWADLALRDEAYQELLVAWLQWRGADGEWENMCRGIAALLAARADAAAPQEPAQKDPPAVEGVGVDVPAASAAARTAGKTKPAQRKPAQSRPGRSAKRGGGNTRYNDKDAVKLAKAAYKAMDKPSERQAAARAIDQLIAEGRPILGIRREAWIERVRKLL